MTLDEAIIHAEEVAEEKREQAGFDTDNERYRMSKSERADCLKCSEEHRQLAKWLKELKELREQKRPHGKWIRTGRKNVYGGFEIECSCCHTKLMVSPSRWEIGEIFCDVCGSRNKKEGDEK